MWSVWQSERLQRTINRSFDKLAYSDTIRPPRSSRFVDEPCPLSLLSLSASLPYVAWRSSAFRYLQQDHFFQVHRQLHRLFPLFHLAGLLPLEASQARHVLADDALRHLHHLHGSLLRDDRNVLLGQGDGEGVRAGGASVKHSSRPNVKQMFVVNLTG